MVLWSTLKQRALLWHVVSCIWEIEMVLCANWQGLKYLRFQWSSGPLLQTLDFAKNNFCPVVPVVLWSTLKQRALLGHVVSCIWEIEMVLCANWQGLKYLRFQWSSGPLLQTLDFAKNNFCPVVPVVLWSTLKQRALLGHVVSCIWEIQMVLCATWQGLKYSRYQWSSGPLLQTVYFAKKIIFVLWSCGPPWK